MLVRCFSQNRDELILEFEGPSGNFIIRANLDPVISLLSFPSEFARAGRNSIDLFGELVGKNVQSIASYRFERSFYIQFESEDQLIFKMHARRANILRAKNDRTQEIFRKKLSQDLEIIPSLLPQDITITKNSFLPYTDDPLAFIPALGKDVKIFLEGANYQDLTENDQWKLLEGTLTQLAENPIYLHEATLPRISLIEPSALNTMDPIQAATWLYENTARKLFFEKEKEQLISGLRQKVKKSENYIQKNAQKLHELEASRNPEELANLIMANLHSIQQGLSKVVLTDFYRNEPITIQLNVNLSPQKNAEVYYRKAKNRHQELAVIRSNIKDKEKLIDQLSRQMLEIQELDTSKDLRKLKKSKGFGKDKKVEEKSLPYHLFTLDDWQIFVGKNSKANDELTLKIANKNDLWLHAKDVAGSHVVIRERPGQNYPVHIIEYAASLAAANSKRKTDSLCPVLYTKKKYVRKVKGAPAGQVIVEKEEILMIEPFSDDG